jgi:hypothetical protein
MGLYNPYESYFWKNKDKLLASCNELKGKDFTVEGALLKKYKAHMEQRKPSSTHSDTTPEVT